MSEPLSLIPNLNEMMEEYVGNEVEVTHELPMTVIQGEIAQEPLTIATQKEGAEARAEAEIET